MYKWEWYKARGVINLYFLFIRRSEPFPLLIRPNWLLSLSNSVLMLHNALLVLSHSQLISFHFPCDRFFTLSRFCRARNLISNIANISQVCSTEWCLCPAPPWTPGLSSRATTGSSSFWPTTSSARPTTRRCSSSASKKSKRTSWWMPCKCCWRWVRFCLHYFDVFGVKYDVDW